MLKGVQHEVTENGNLVAFMGIPTYRDHQKIESLPQAAALISVPKRPQLVSSAVESAIDTPYSEHVNPQWVRLLDLLEMNVRYERCLGSELFTSDGRRILDFLSLVTAYTTSDTITLLWSQRSRTNWRVVDLP